MQVGGRPARFARYTGRTPFPGVVPLHKAPESIERWLSSRLKPLSFYAKLQKDARGNGDRADRARDLIRQLKRLGKWPSKPNFLAWFGRGPFVESGQLQRVTTQLEDSELLLRLEVQHAVPDLLMTNYSMLEYMLLRPIEREIWTQTRDYYRDTPDARLLLILDEAHLYRGASGTEVALLLRRLAQRLELPPERLQIICTSASFHDRDHARRFAAALSGKSEAGFQVLQGERLPALPSGPTTEALAEALLKVDLAGLHSMDAATRVETSQPVLELGGLHPPEGSTPELNAWLGEALHKILKPQPLVGRLLNLTSGAQHPSDAETKAEQPGAQQIEQLAGRLFGTWGTPEQRSQATDSLIELACLAREGEQPPLLAARAHVFFRGLPGLWVCLNPGCSEVPPDSPPAPAGRLYPQPRLRCGCGARVLELHTCRDCGIAVAIGYSDQPTNPRFLWDSAGGGFDSGRNRLQPVHVVLEAPSEDGTAGDQAVEVELDPITGRLDSGSKQTRPVWLVEPNVKRTDREKHELGLFPRCPRCGAEHKISDHQTRGDEPFQGLVSTQLLEQPPQPGSSTPLKGRKVMIFSDGRQSASRMAGKLQNFSLGDAVRPLLIEGYRLLHEHGKLEEMPLSYAYPAVLLAATRRDLELPVTESSAEQLRGHRRLMQDVLTLEPPALSEGLRSLFGELADKAACAEILLAIYQVLNSAYYSLEALALGSFGASIPS